MGTTTDKLNRLIDTKEGIRQEINRAYNTEEISTSNTFNSYIQKLEEHPFYVKGFIERTLKRIKLSNITSIGREAFHTFSNLTSAVFPNVTSIGKAAFQQCDNLTEISFPNATSIDDNSFAQCTGLTSISFPKVTRIGSYVFFGCTNLHTIYVGTDTSTVCTLGSTVFNNCTSLTNIYVPASLVNSYKSATNWSEHASKIKAAP